MRPSTAPVTSQRRTTGTSGSMSGVNSNTMSESSQPVRSMPVVSAKSLRHARSSDPDAGSGDSGVEVSLEARDGVAGGRRAWEGDGDRGRFCERLVKRGSIAAIRIAVASGVLWVSAAVRGPVLPRGLDATKRLSRTPSNSMVFGGSCFVASLAACCTGQAIVIYNKEHHLQ
jgi:hypothetical protein